MLAIIRKECMGCGSLVFTAFCDGCAPPSVVRDVDAINSDRRHNGFDMASDGHAILVRGASAGRHNGHLIRVGAP